MGYIDMTMEISGSGARPSPVQALTFSIITVVFNDCEGLKRTWLSLRQQAPEGWEWLVIDGASGGEMPRLLADIEAWGGIVLSEPDRGIYDAMNKGLVNSSGEYVVFMNADDVFQDTNVLALVRDEINRQGKPDVIFGGWQYILANGRHVSRSPKLMERSIWHGLPANHQATYYKRIALEGLLYDPAYRICGDYYLIAKLFLKGVRAGYIKKPLVKFKVGGMSHQNPKFLFLEPYRIQRDILGNPLYIRVFSLLRRMVARFAIIFLEKA